jgi:RNA polymerase sigma factor (sigma-70 family)
MSRSDSRKHRRSPRTNGILSQMTEPNFESMRRPLVARLTQKFGSNQLELIFDAVQESFLTAMTSWPHHGLPENPLAWLSRVAERKLIDQLRSKNRELPVNEEITTDQGTLNSEIALYVMVCSPKLTIREQVCLALRTLAGLTSQEIARLLLESEEAVQRRISRSKDKLSNEDLSPRNPEEHLPVVLTTLYLLFTEGYESGRGEEYIRPDLAYSALRLAEELRSLLSTPNGELEALLALMHFHSARLPARVTNEGEMVFLEDQDHSKLNQTHVSKGFYYLQTSQSSPNLSRYHLEAGLAAAFVRRAPPEEVKHWHELLITHFPTPMNLISYSLSVKTLEGPESGLQVLENHADRIEPAQPAHFHSAKAYLLTELNRIEEAKLHYQKAMAHSMSAPSLRGLERRLQELSLNEP